MIAAALFLFVAACVSMHEHSLMRGSANELMQQLAVAGQRSLRAQAEIGPGGRTPQDRKTAKDTNNAKVHSGQEQIRASHYK
jgi:hypothetical protein